MTGYATARHRCRTETLATWRYHADTMRLNEETTWPSDVLDYLEQHRNLFLAWELKGAGATSSPEAAREAARKYDTAVYGLRAVLSRHALEGGYHCTRLTKSEIHHIMSNGLQLPNRAMLLARIQAIQDARLIEPYVAERLRSRNQADEPNRAGMIWFCFFPPHLAGQGGIERFFRHWGGEALYNSHERDQLTGPILSSIGTPCLIEADVPIASLEIHSFLDNHVIRQFLINRGLETSESVDHEDRAKYPLPVSNIRRIIQFPEPEFVTLTDCDDWTPPLS
jgi:hypothetical protein